ncbi:MAG: PilZ domain-containing protein [Deltaproteobacteria bacterium]|nr:PilZ domain-containing protein [Deltaproteobacteria bacterium]
MILEVLIGPLGWAVVICPQCGLKSHTRPGKELKNKILDRVCTCGLKYQLIFDSRSAQRKKCSFPGILLAEKDIPIIIRDISKIGASFENDGISLEIGSFYNLKIRISEDWVKVLTRIVRVSEKIVGVEFSGLDEDQKKTIGSYLPSS